MNKHKHTEGPWITGTHGSHGEIPIREKNGYLIATVWGDDSNNETADAKLIAAAPELLEALREIRKGQGRYSQDQLEHASNTIEDMKEIADKAISLATGRE